MLSDLVESNGLNALRELHGMNGLDELNTLEGKSPEPFNASDTFIKPLKGIRFN